MVESSNYVQQQKGAWVERVQATIEVLLLSGIVSSFFAALPFSLRRHDARSMLTDARSVTSFLLLEASISLVFLALVLKAHGETLKDLGLVWQRWRSKVTLGIAIVPVLFAISICVAQGFRIFLPKYFIERNPLTEIIRTPLDLGLFLVSALVAGGLKEELQRAFILSRFRDHLGGATLGLVVWSAVFGIGHYVQGPQGVVAAGLFGLFFGVVYLATGNLLPPITAHAVYDSLALVGFWFFGR